MEIKKKIICASLLASIVGCAHRIELLDSVVYLNQSHRVIEHNFNRKYSLLYESNDVSIPILYKQNEKVIEQNTETSKAPVTNTEKSTLAFVDVDFYNESAVVKNREEVLSKIKETIDSDRYLIVGHSHGKSVIGVETLASKRARYLSGVLFVSGVPRENIIYISSWSDGNQPYDIPRGARIIGLPKNLDPNIALLTGLTIKEDKS